MPKPKRPAFFKVFIEHVSSEMMKIPPGFCKYMQNKKSRVVCLTGPSGNTSKIDLIETTGRLFFGEGWKTFWKDHSVETGHFFTFKFDGEVNSKDFKTTMLLQHTEAEPLPKSFLHFKVKIYDTTYCEKKNIAIAAKPLRMCTDLIKVEEDGVKVKPASTKDRKRIFLHTSGPGEPSSTNPPSFVSSVHQDFYFTIRKEFRDKYLRHYSSRSEVLLRCGEDKYKEWIVTVIREKEPPKARCVISKGWPSFRNDNQLKKGDMLRFEMVGDFRFNVHKI